MTFKLFIGFLQIVKPYFIENLVTTPAERNPVVFFSISTVETKYSFAIHTHTNPWKLTVPRQLVVSCLCPGPLVFNDLILGLSLG